MHIFVHFPTLVFLFLLDFDDGVYVCVWEGQGKGKNENRGDVDSGMCGANISCIVCVFALIFCLWYICFMPWSP